MSSHQIYNRRGTDHQRHARMANPDGPHGYDPPTKRDLYEPDLRPRFSPTAIFPGDDDPGTSTAPTQDPTDSPADPTSSPADSSQDPVTTSSTTPVVTSDPLADSSTTPTTTATTSSSSSSSDTPTATSTPSAVISTSTSTATPTTTSSSTSLTSAAPTVVLPTSSVSTFTNTNVAPHASSIASSATPSATPSTSGGTSTSLVVGGIAAGLVGLAGLIFAILFFLRRWRKRGEDEQEFNAEAFRRQSAVLVDDEPGSFSGSKEANAGFNPRPPTMIERHMANRNQFDSVPPMPSMQHYNNVGASSAGGAGMGAGGYGNGYDYPSPQPSFGPGQFMPSTSSPPPPSPSPQFFGAYGQAPMPNDAVYNDQGPLSRRPSNATALHNENGHLSVQRDLSRQNSVSGSAHYVDLDRSSVTPFQAAQYAEISRKLNEAPPPLHVVSEADEEPISQASDREMYASQAGEAHAHLSIPAEGANASPESPFTDPQVPAEVHNQPLTRLVHSFDAQDAVVPPSPIYSLHSEKVSHERGPSNPPSLPEIQVPDRTFSPTSYDFPQTPSARPTPSPFHTNFSIPSPPIREQYPQSLTVKAAESAASSAPAPTQAPAPNMAEREVTPKPQSQRPSSTYTVYDEMDPYGGF